MKGTVIKRGAKWVVVVDLGRDVDGRRIRKWHSGYPTKREAEAARVEILSSLQHGGYVAPSKVTVSEWCEQWLENRQGIADTTRVGYTSDVKRVARGDLGPVRLSTLTPMAVSAWYRKLSDAYSPKTIRNTHTTLSRALKDAVRVGVVVRNAAQDAELPKLERPDSPAWTADQLRTFLNHVRDHRLYAAWQLACSTGMRRSEVMGLRWQSVDFDQGRLAVVDTLVLVNSRPVHRLGQTKSASSRRVIALDERTLSVLKSHRTRQLEERLRASTAWADTGLVFCNELGGPVDLDKFTRTTKKYAVEAGVPALTLHQASRHTWATLALMQGVNAKVVQERLGHASIAITLDRYSHLVDGMDRDAAETVAALIGGAQ
jgi:integrase